MMRRGLLIIGLLCWAPSVQAAPEAFIQANGKYQERDFRAAAALYEELLKNQGPTAVLYYNLANSYFRLGEKGRARLYYERAALASPRDPDIHWNLEILKSVLVDRVETPEEDLVWSLVKRALRLVSADEIAWGLGLCLLALAVLMLSDFLWPASRSWTFIFKAAAVLGLFASCLSLGVRIAEMRSVRAVVLAKEVSARYGPSEKETQAFVLHEGADPRVLDELPGWRYVTLNGKDSGWVPKDSCEVI